MIKSVITAAGRAVPRNKAVTIDNNWYEVVSRYNIAESPKDSAVVVEELSKSSPAHRRLAPIGKYYWNFKYGRYDLKTDNFIKCIVDGLLGILPIEEASIIGIEGCFSPHDSVNSSNAIGFINEESAKKEGYALSPYNGLWYSSKYITLPESKYVLNKFYDTSNSGQLNHLLIGNYGKCRYQGFNTDLYGENGNPAFATSSEIVKPFIKSIPAMPISKFNRFLGNYSYGAEFEAWFGFLGEQKCKQHGLIPVRDGSLEGASYEYITTVLYPQQKILERVQLMCEDMSKVLTANKSCSLHFHVGNAPTDKKFVVALWMLLYQINNEFFQIIPPYKKELAYLLTKRPHPKDHCQSLPSLNLIELSKTIKNKDISDLNKFVLTAFDRILLFLNGENNGLPQYDEKNGRYIHALEGRNKWDIPSRYMAINFLPALFEKKKTYEFRTHSPTFNKYKTINWQFIITAVLEYTKLNQDNILLSKYKISLSDIMEVFNDGTEEGGYLTNYLKAYILERKEENYALTQQKNLYGQEFITDAEYMFTFMNTSIFGDNGK